MDIQYKHGRNAFLGFLTTFFLFWFVFALTLICPLQRSLFSSGSLSNLLEDFEVSEVLNDLASDEIYKSLNEYGFTKKDIDNVLPKELVDNALDTVTLAIENGDKSVDFTALKEDAVIMCNNMANLVIDDYVAALSTNNGDINSTRIDTSTSKALASLDIDVNSIISETLITSFGNTIDMTVITEAALKDALHNMVSTSIETEIVPDIDSSIDEIEEAVSEALEDAKIPDISFSRIDSDNSITLTESYNYLKSDINGSILFLLVISLFLFLIQFTFYQNRRYKAIKNLGIVTAISGFFILIIGIIPLSLKGAIRHAVYDSKAEFDISEFIANAISVLMKPYMIMGIVLIFVTIACFVASSLWKRRVNRDYSTVTYVDDINPVQTGFYNNNSGFSYDNQVNSSTPTSEQPIINNTIEDDGIFDYEKPSDKAEAVENNNDLPLN